MDGVLAYLSIGDFSRATHLTVKTLRHYHRTGLLEPADVDPHTGYRRYTAEQIPLAQIIRRRTQQAVYSLRDLLQPPPRPPKNGSRYAASRQHQRQRSERR